MYQCEGVSGHGSNCIHADVSTTGTATGPTTETTIIRRDGWHLQGKARKEAEKLGGCVDIHANYFASLLAKL
jgi:hypothetical protein